MRLLELNSSTQVIARSVVDGWYVAGWIRTNNKGTFHEYRDFVWADSTWSERRFRTTEELLRAVDQALATTSSPQHF